MIAREMQRTGAAIRSLAEPYLDTTSDFAEIVFAIRGADSRHAEAAQRRRRGQDIGAGCAAASILAAIAATADAPLQHTGQAVALYNQLTPCKNGLNRVDYRIDLKLPELLSAKRSEFRYREAQLGHARREKEPRRQGANRGGTQV